MVAVLKRELKSYFNNPIGYIILAVFTFFSGMFFTVLYKNGAPNVENVISVMSTIAIFATPFITMRLLSEDRRQKVDQVLLTAPVKISEIVLGKFFAAFSLYAAGFFSTLIFQFIVAARVSLNWAIYFYALLGILLLGAVMISIGMFLSSLTESPVVSAALTFAVFLTVMLLGSFVESNNNVILSAINKAISFIDRFSNFITGVFSLNDIIYMLSITGVFVFLTVCSVAKRRWA